MREPSKRRLSASWRMSAMRHSCSGIRIRACFHNLDVLSAIFLFFKWAQTNYCADWQEARTWEAYRDGFACRAGPMGLSTRMAPLLSDAGLGTIGNRDEISLVADLVAEKL